MNKKKMFIIIVIVLILYLLYKTFNLYYFSYVYTTDEKRNMDYEKVYIKTLRMISNSKYESLHINIPDEFKYDDEISKKEKILKVDWYMKRDKINKDIYSAITINKSDMNLESFLKEGGVRKIDYSNVLKNNNINNCFDLIEYYKKHHNKKQTIFTPVSKMKMNHLANVYVYFNLPAYKKIYKLNGGLTGYLLEAPSGKYFVAYIMNKDDIYVVNFNNAKEQKYFTYKKVIEILQSIYFE